MAGLIAAALGGSTISAGSQLGSTAMQTNQQQSIVNQGVQAYKDANMPTFMYFSGQQAHMPNTNVSLGGSNYYNTTGVNLNTPTITNSYQQYNKTGKPENVQYGRPGLGSGPSAYTNFMSAGKPLMWSSAGSSDPDHQHIGSTSFNPRMAPNPTGSSSIKNQMSSIWDM